MPDVYAMITEVDPDLQEQLATVLELRAADPAQRAMLAEYTAGLDLPDGGAVLEVGCGTGPVCRHLATLPGVASVTGVDPSPLFVERARELSPDLTFAVGDGRALDLPDDGFDAVVFHTSLCHIPDVELALAEARRVLRPGGRLAAFDGDYATMTFARDAADPLQSCAAAVIEMVVFDPWLMRRIVPLVTAAGFTGAQVRGHGYTSAGPGTDYLLALVDRGADALAARGTIGAPLADALKAEGRARMESGAFFGHIDYVSVNAQAAAATGG
jgi:ubiquinone/menaquinone biosynthesis C-methylase UbiE